MADRSTRAYVGARRIIRVLSVQPAVARPAGRRAPSPAAGVELTDPVSGLVVTPRPADGRGLGPPEESAALADRLGRFGLRRRDGAAATTGPRRAARRGAAVGPAPGRRAPPDRRQRDRTSSVHRHSARRAGRPGRRGRSPTTTSGPPSRWPARPTRSTPCRTGWTAGSRSAAARSPAGSGSAWPWPGCCCATPRRWCWSSRRVPSTPTPRPGSASGCGPLAPGRSTVVMTSSPLMLDHADRVVFLAGGRVRRPGHPRGAVGARPRRTGRSSCAGRRRDAHARTLGRASARAAACRSRPRREVRAEARRLFARAPAADDARPGAARPGGAGRPGRRRRSSAGWCRSSARTA